MTVTAQLQGALNVPMYKAPYTFPTTNPVSGVKWQFVPTNGEMPLMTSAKNNAVQVASTGDQMAQAIQGLGYAVNGSTGIYAALVNQLTYTALETLTIGSGAPVAGTSVVNGIRGSTATPLMFDSNLVWSSVGFYTTIGPNQLVRTVIDASLANVAFPATRSVPPITVNPMQNQNQESISATTFVNNVVNLHTSRICIYISIDTGDPFLPTSVGVGSVYGIGTLFGGPSFSVCMQANFGITGVTPFNLSLDSAPSGFPSLLAEWISPDMIAGTNYIWLRYSGTTFPKVSSSPVNFIVGQGLVPVIFNAFEDWQTDNAIINAAISQQFASFMPVNGGFLMSINSGVATGIYFVDKTGTKYWTFNLQTGAPGGAKFRNLPIDIADLNITIDGNGIVWYIGLDAQSGGVTQPYFSLALNIPYGGVNLPTYLPPIGGPCWSDCLDRVGGRPGNLNPTGAPLSPGVAEY